MPFTLQFIPQSKHPATKEAMAQTIACHSLFMKQKQSDGTEYYLYRHPYTKVAFTLKMQQSDTDTFIEANIPVGFPAFYGTEVFLALKPIVEKLELLVVDPQKPTKTPEAFDKKELSIRWLTANAFALGALETKNRKRSTAPASTLFAWWDWMFAAPFFEALNTEYRNKDIFVPPMHLWRINNRALNGVVWANHIHQAFPRVFDTLCILTLSNPWIGKPKMKEGIFIPWDEALKILWPYLKEASEPMHHFRILLTDEEKAQVGKKLKTLPLRTPFKEAEEISPLEVLDEEMETQLQKIEKIENRAVS